MNFGTQRFNAVKIGEVSLKAFNSAAVRRKTPRCI
jgi:hypothetical protein